MSSTVRSSGFIAILVNALDAQQREEIGDKLWDADSSLSVSYDGKLLIMDHWSQKPMCDREDVYGLNIGDGAKESSNDFIAEANNQGLQIHVESILPFNCIWYNGADNPVCELTKEEFMTYLHPSNVPKLLSPD